MVNHNSKSQHQQIICAPIKSRCFNLYPAMTHFFYIQTLPPPPASFAKTPTSHSSSKSKLKHLDLIRARENKWPGAHDIFSLNARRGCKKIRNISYVYDVTYRPYKLIKLIKN
jgi:hypothetical protein